MEVIEGKENEINVSILCGTNGQKSKGNMKKVYDMIGDISTKRNG